MFNKIVDFSKYNHKITLGTLNTEKHLKTLPYATSCMSSKDQNYFKNSKQFNKLYILNVLKLEIIKILILELSR